MEAAFKQMMQQQGGNNEIVTLTTTDGKSLEFITDPSQAEALMQVAAQSQGSTELLQDVQDVIKQNLMQIGGCKTLGNPIYVYTVDIAINQHALLNSQSNSFDLWISQSKCSI